MAARLSRIWVKIDKQLQLSGVRVDGEIIRSEPQKTIALGASWQATFNPKPYDVAAADTLLAQSGDIGGYEDVPPTTIFDYMEAHGIGKNGSRPGPDGIPYVAWASAGPIGDDTLYTTDKSIRNGREPPPNFNESGISFIPKGEEEADPVEIIRNANDNRPISTKNTDNKVIIAVNTYKLKDRYSANTHSTQRGFVGGRNFLGNVLDLDSASRIYSMFKVLEHRKLPQHYMNLYMAIYRDAHAIITHKGNRIIILNFLSGVLQGCPGSAFLFNNSLDPFLYLLHRILREKRQEF